MFVDQNLEIVIIPQFDFAHPFIEGIAAVEIEGYWGFISKSGKSYHLHQQEELSVQDILKQLNVSKATFYRYLDWAKNNMDQKPKKRKAR